MKKAVILVSFFFFQALSAYGQFVTHSPAAYINSQYQKRKIICLDEGPHATLQAHEFIRSLIANDTVYNKLNYIIVEFANTKYQSILDNYISGQEIPLNELQQVWRNSTQAHSLLYESPVYLKLLETVREVNSLLPDTQKIRVIGGDPEIDWSSITTIDDYYKSISQRDVFASELAIEYGIKQGKNVLMIFGGEHLRKDSDKNKDSTYWTIPYYINNKIRRNLLTIGIVNTEPAGIDHTTIPLNSVIEVIDYNSIYDAYYYVGDPNAWQKDKPSKIDKEYWKELDRRSKIVWGEGLDRKFIK